MQLLLTYMTLELPPIPQGSGQVKQLLRSCAVDSDDQPRPKSGRSPQKTLANHISYWFLLWHRYSPSSKEFVTTLSKIPSSVPRRHSPSGLSPPVMSERQQQPQQPAESKRSNPNQLSPHDSSSVNICFASHQCPPLDGPSIGPSPIRDFGDVVGEGRKHKASRLVSFWLLFWPKKTATITTQTEAQSEGEIYQKRRPADAWRRVSDTSAIGHYFEEETLGKVHHLSYIQLLTRLSEWTSLIGNQQYIRTHARTDRLPSSVAHPPSWWRANQSGASSMMYVEPRFSPQQLWWVFDFQSLISESFDREWKQNPGKAPQSGCFESLINQQSGLAINLWPSACWLAAAADDDDEESCAPETRSRYTGRADKAKIYLPVNHQFSDDFILRYSQQSSQLQMS